MLDEIGITKKLYNSLQRVLQRVPKKLQKDEEVLHITAAYLKIGGEKLARQSVEVFKAINKLETDQRKERLRNEAFLRSAEARNIRKLDENKSHANQDDNEIYLS